MTQAQNIIEEIRKKCIDPNCATQKTSNVFEKDQKPFLCYNCHEAMHNLDQEELLEIYTGFTDTIKEQDYRILLFTVLSNEEALSILHFIVSDILTENQHEALDFLVKDYIKEDYFDLANEMMQNSPVKKDED